MFSAVTVKLKEPPNRFASDLSDADLADLADTQAAPADGEERGRDVRDGMLATPNEAHLAHLTQTPTVSRPRCGRRTDGSEGDPCRSGNGLRGTLAEMGIRLH